MATKTVLILSCDNPTCTTEIVRPDTGKYPAKFPQPKGWHVSAGVYVGESKRFEFKDVYACSHACLEPALQAVAQP